MCSAASDERLGGCWAHRRGMTSDDPWRIVGRVGGDGSEGGRSLPRRGPMLAIGPAIQPIGARPAGPLARAIVGR